MPIADQIEQDFIQAMKSKNADLVSTLRMVKAAFSNYKIEKKKDKLEDPEAVEVLQKQVKQRRESVESFEKAGRQDLAGKEKKEITFLEKYLPKQLADEEIKTLARKAVAASGAKTKADAGKVMKELMPAVKGKADGKRVNEIVMSLLG